MHGVIPPRPLMPSYSSAKLRTTTFLFYSTTVLCMKSVLFLDFTTFHYKLYDILDQD